MKLSSINRQMRDLLINHVYGNTELIHDRKLAQQRLGQLFQFSGKATRIVFHPAIGRR